MPFTSVTGASSVIKPGVVTSSTRPSAPYVGQLIFETDTNRLAAYNGSSWITQNGLAVVQPETTLTSAATLTLDGCFTSSYTNYRLHINATASSTSTMLFQLRVGGVTAATNYNRQYIDASSTTLSGGRETSQTSLNFGILEADFRGTTIIEIFQPAQAQFTNFYSQNIYSSGASTTNLLWYQISGIHSASTAYDGFIITFGSNATGTYTLYGYGK